MSESVVVLNPFLSTAISADSASAGAFGRLRVGNPLTLWDSQFQYDKGFTPFAIAPKIRLARSFDASSSDIVTLAVRSLDNPSSDLFASMQWAEFAC